VCESFVFSVAVDFIALPKDVLKHNEKPYNFLKNDSCLKSCGILHTTPIEDAGET
jgi:hypothetical protein